MKRFGGSKAAITDRLRSYGAAMKNMGIVERHLNCRNAFK
jgi:hypothetical protein